jgi:hypothetical protein
MTTVNPAPTRSNALATASIIVGVLSLVFSWVPILGLLAGLTAAGLGIAGMRRANRGPDIGHGQAIAGVILGACAAILGLVVTIAVMTAAGHAANSSTPLGFPDSPPAFPARVDSSNGAKPGIPPSSFDDGTWAVGSEITPGTYRSPGPLDDNIGICMWQRLSGTGGTFPEVIASDISQGRSTITVQATDAAVKFSGCKDFVKVN